MSHFLNRPLAPADLASVRGKRPDIYANYHIRPAASGPDEQAKERGEHGDFRSGCAARRGGADAVLERCAGLGPGDCAGMGADDGVDVMATTDPDREWKRRIEDALSAEYGAHWAISRQTKRLDGWAVTLEYIEDDNNSAPPVTLIRPVGQWTHDELRVVAFEHAPDLVASVEELVPMSELLASLAKSAVTAEVEGGIS